MSLTPISSQFNSIRKRPTNINTKNEIKRPYNGKFHFWELERKKYITFQTMNRAQQHSDMFVINIFGIESNPDAAKYKHK
jgi:hypothetical protein